MNCEQAKPLIQPYTDGELDAARILELERHIHDCPACASAWQSIKNLKKVLKSDALYFKAPNELRRHLNTELNSQVGDRTERKFWNWSWLTATTSSVAVACLALLLLVNFTRPSAQQQFAQEIVSSHIRSLMANHELDVISTDQHTVKPWFDGKLDFSPPVKDFAVQGFPLIGGRLDYLGGHTVAALVYQRNKHIINLFVWPTKEGDSKPETLSAIQGYNLVHWSEAGMIFWAVSDVNANDLLEFSKNWDVATSPAK